MALSENIINGALDRAKKLRSAPRPYLDAPSWNAHAQAERRLNPPIIKIAARHCASAPIVVAGIKKMIRPEQMSAS